MQKINMQLFLRLVIITACLAGCANDLVIDYGKGDSIRLVGGADSFDCDDPAYANVKKVRTWTMSFADGTKYLCSTEESVAAEKLAAENATRQGHGESEGRRVEGGAGPNPSFKLDSPTSGRAP